MEICRLSSQLISQIAAGEMIFSPAQVVKELTENAIDACADRIVIELCDAGRKRIIVKDNGCGIPRAQIPMAVERHTTSKLHARAPIEAVNALKTRGFRGEALASIAVSSRLTITTKAHQDDACSLVIDQGKVGTVVPVAHGQGTSVFVENLFDNIPVRKKFLPSSGACLRAVQRIFKYQALSRMDIGFHLKNKKTLYHFPPHMEQETLDVDKWETPLRDRTRLLFARDLFNNAHFVSKSYQNMTLWGLIVPPPETARNAEMQYFFVNGRAIKDRFLSWFLRSAFYDVLEHERHPIAVLFLRCAHQDVDINVHPTKEQVRFSNKQAIRKLFFDTVRSVLAPPSHTPTGDKHVASISKYVQHKPVEKSFLQVLRQSSVQKSPSITVSPALSSFISQEEERKNPVFQDSPSFAPPEEQYPLGRAIAQVHQTYIVAQAVDIVILVDQHAAHERVLYEGMKRLLKQNKPSHIRTLLIPEVVPMARDDVDTLLAQEDELKHLGISLEAFGDSVVVRSLPDVLSKRLDIQKFIKDIVADIACWKTTNALEERLKDLCGNIACKNSIKAGTFLTLEQMNALLRAMEKTPKAGHCNHGRPTYIHLRRKDLDKLFHRR